MVSLLAIEYEAALCGFWTHGTASTLARLVSLLMFRVVFLSQSHEIMYYFSYAGFLSNVYAISNAYIA